MIDRNYIRITVNNSTVYMYNNTNRDNTLEDSYYDPIYNTSQQNQQTQSPEQNQQTQDQETPEQNQQTQDQQTQRYQSQSSYNNSPSTLYYRTYGSHLPTVRERNRQSRYSDLLTPRSILSNFNSNLNQNTLDFSGGNVTTNVVNDLLGGIIDSVLTVPTNISSDILQMDIANPYIYNQRTSVSTLFRGTTLSVISNENVNNPDNTCAICHNTYQANDIIRKINTCEHYFHASCVEQWFQNHESCPICRGSLINRTPITSQTSNSDNNDNSDNNNI